MGVTLLVFSLLPYFTTFVGENFYEFFPQFMYGLCFLTTAVLSMLIGKYVKEADPANIALQLALDNYYPMYGTIIMVLIGMVIGYFIYPPAVMICCLLSIVGIWCIPKIQCYIS